MVKGQKYHMLYKTTCTVTGNFYVGVHSTTNLEDDYLGSGIRLSRSIAKHGKENHVREILEIFEEKEKMYKREREIVNEEMLADHKCMNLKRGGEGGLPRFTQKEKKDFHIKGAIEVNKLRVARHLNLLKNDPKYRENFIDRIVQGREKSTGSKNCWLGRHHTEKGKANIAKALSVAQKGEKNSQFGKVWIFHEQMQSSVAVKIEDVERYFAEGWKKGRKRNFAG